MTIDSRTYVIARTAGGRPTVQHRISQVPTFTACGRDTSPWSCAYQTEPIEVIRCKAVGCRDGA
jgi:hypothetical protein